MEVIDKKLTLIFNVKKYKKSVFALKPPKNTFEKRQNYKISLNGVF